MAARIDGISANAACSPDATYTSVTRMSTAEHRQSTFRLAIVDGAQQLVRSGIHEPSFIRAQLHDATV